MVKKKGVFNYLLRKMFRDLKIGWKQFLAIVFISTLSITLYVGLSSNAKSLETRVNTLYEGGNMADLWVYLSAQSAGEVDDIKEICGEDAQIETRFTYDTKLNGSDATACISRNYPYINRPYYVSNDIRDNYFIVDQNFSSLFGVNTHVREGEECTVSVTLASLMSNLDISESQLETLDTLARGTTTEEKKANNIFRQGKVDFKMTVTSLMMHPENVQNSTFSNSIFLLDYDYFFIVFKDMIKEHFIDGVAELVEAIINIGGQSEVEVYNQIVIKLGKGKKVSQIKTQIEEYYGNPDRANNYLLYVTEKDGLPSNAVIQNDIEQAKALNYIFPMIFFIVAVLVTLTTLSQIIIKERTQIGTLKALGISRKTIFLHYLSLAFFIDFIGIILGSIIGPLLIPNIMGIKYSLLYTLPKMTIIFPALDFTIISLVFLSVTFLVTLFVTHTELKLNPVQSMRPTSLKSLKPKKKEGKNKFFSTKMTFRNIRRDKVKSIMVVLGVLGCTALLVCGFGIDDTINYGIELDVSHFYEADLLLTYQGGSSSQIDAIKNTSVKDGKLEDYIIAVDEYSKLPATVKHDDYAMSYSVLGVTPGTEFFDFPISEENLCITTKMARELHVKVGDEISFSVLGSNYTGIVEQTFDSFSVHSVVFNKELAKYSSISAYCAGGWIDVDESKITAEEVQEALKDNTSITTISTTKENRDRINSIMSSISYMTMAVKTFAILLAIIVLYNLVLLNYRERTRDIATLKVLGFSKMEIAKSLIFEVMFLTTIGIGIGMLLGMPMQILVLIVNQTPIVDFLYTTSIASYIISFFLTFGTSVVTNLLLSNLTGRIKMVESLKSVE